MGDQLNGKISIKKVMSLFFSCMLLVSFNSCSDNGDSLESTADTASQIAVSSYDSNEVITDNFFTLENWKTVSLDHIQMTMEIPNYLEKIDQAEGDGTLYFQNDNAPIAISVIRKNLEPNQMSLVKDLDALTEFLKIMLSSEQPNFQFFEALKSDMPAVTVQGTYADGDKTNTISLFAIPMRAIKSIAIFRFDIANITTETGQVAGNLIGQTISSMKHTEDSKFLDPIQDFSADETRLKEYNQAITELDFTKVSKIVNFYIEKTQPDEFDTALIIKNILDKNAPALSDYEKEYDEFDKNNIIYAKGIKKISKQIGIVPSINSSDNSTQYSEFQVGFVKSGWLFFDKGLIKIGDEELTTFYNSDKNREVLKGGTIQEDTTVTLSLEDLGKLAEAQNATIVFRNSDNKKTYEHKITKSEFSAIKTMYRTKKTIIYLLNPDTYVSSN